MGQGCQFAIPLHLLDALLHENHSSDFRTVMRIILGVSIFFSDLQVF